MKKARTIDPKYNELHNQMLTVFRMLGDQFTAKELLAVSAQVTGQLIALQKCNEKIAMKIVKENLVIGNVAAIKGAMQLPLKEK